MHLPLEIIYQICMHLRPDYNNWNYHEFRPKLHALRNICLASKAVAEIARPSLWHAVAITWQSLAKLPSLVDRIIERPELSRLIRELHFEISWETEHDLQLGRSSKLSASKQTLELVDGLSLPATLKERLHKDIRGGFHDAFVALLLAVCDRIEVADLKAPHNMVDACSMAVVQNDQTLQHLKIIKAAHWDTENATRIDELLPFFQKPALENFEGHQIDCTELAPPNFVASKVRTIGICHSLLDASGLSCLLKACPNVETISVQVGDGNVGHCDTDFGKLGEVLRNHGTKLKSLSFSLEEDSVTFEDIAEMPLGSLKALSLRDLSLPIPALFLPENPGASDDDASHEEARMSPNYLRDMLPASLETLEIIVMTCSKFRPYHGIQVTELFASPSLRNLHNVRVHDEKCILEYRSDENGQVCLKEEALPSHLAWMPS